MKKIVVHLDPDKTSEKPTKEDLEELQAQMEKLAKVFKSMQEENHHVQEGLMILSGVKGLYEKEKGNIEAFIKKKGGILPSSTAEFMRWLAKTHPELRDVSVRNLQIKREHFLEFSREIEMQLESNFSDYNDRSNLDPIKFPDRHPFTTPESYEVFKFFSKNYSERNKARWTYIFEFLIDSKIDSYLTEDHYFEWVRKHFQRDMSPKKHPNANSNRKFQKLNKLFESYQSKLG